jgi:hypothetical protein
MIAANEPRWRAVCRTLSLQVKGQPAPGQAQIVLKILVSVCRRASRPMSGSGHSRRFRDLALFYAHPPKAAEIHRSTSYLCHEQTLLLIHRPPLIPITAVCTSSRDCVRMSRKPTWLIHSRHCAAVYSKPPAVSISMLRLDSSA